jgi:hypothetical protein
MPNTSFECFFKTIHFRYCYLASSQLAFVPRVHDVEYRIFGFHFLAFSKETVHSQLQPVSFLGVPLVVGGIPDFGLYQILHLLQQRDRFEESGKGEIQEESCDVQLFPHAVLVGFSNEIRF